MCHEDQRTTWLVFTTSALRICKVDSGEKIDPLHMLDAFLSDLEASPASVRKDDFYLLSRGRNLIPRSYSPT